MTETPDDRRAALRGDQRVSRFGPGRAYFPGGPPEGVPCDGTEITLNTTSARWQARPEPLTISGTIDLGTALEDLPAYLAPAETTAERFERILGRLTEPIDLAAPHRTVTETLAAIDHAIGPDAYCWSPDMDPEPDWGAPDWSAT